VSPSYKLDVNGDINVSGVYKKGGTAGVSVSCSTGQIPNGITVSGGIITYAGTCTNIGGSATVNYNIYMSSCESNSGAHSQNVVVACNSNEKAISGGCRCSGQTGGDTIELTRTYPSTSGTGCSEGSWAVSSPASSWACHCKSSIGDKITARAWVLCVPK
jgi:hypothetical protein